MSASKVASATSVAPARSESKETKQPKQQQPKRPYCLHDFEHDAAMDLTHDVTKVLHMIPGDRLIQFTTFFTNAYARTDLSEQARKELVSEELRLNYRNLYHVNAEMGPLSNKTKNLLRQYFTILHSVHVPGYQISSDCCLISNSSLDSVIRLQLNDRTMKPRWRSNEDHFGPKSLYTHATNFLRLRSTNEDTIVKIRERAKNEIEALQTKFALYQSQLDQAYKNEVKSCTNLKERLGELVDASDQAKLDFKKQAVAIETKMQNSIKECQETQNQVDIDEFFANFESGPKSHRTRWLALNERMYSFATKEWCLDIYHPTIDLLDPPENLVELAKEYVAYRAKWLATKPSHGAYWLWADAMRAQKMQLVPSGHLYCYADEYRSNSSPWHCSHCDNKSKVETAKIKTKDTSAPMDLDNMSM